MTIRRLPQEFYDEIDSLSFREITYQVTDAFFGRDVLAEILKEIVYGASNSDAPLVQVKDNIYSLGLFHGPTFTFKDMGGQFIARLLSYFIHRESRKQVDMLVTTSGDTGSVVADGFLGVEGIHVYVLYLKGKVNKVQEKQFTTLGQNITALEVDGTFDDCQTLVKATFMNGELDGRLLLTSANSINVAHFLPQAFYYFCAYAQLERAGRATNAAICMSSENFGNITAGLFGKKMGLPIRHFIVANNRNGIFYQYLQTGQYNPRPSVTAITNAMDVDDPSNFARVLDLYDDSHAVVAVEISDATYTDRQIRETMGTVWQETGYLLNPYGACGFRTLEKGSRPGETGIFLEAAHSARFSQTVGAIIGTKVEISVKLRAFVEGGKQSLPATKEFANFKSYLLSR